MNVVAELTLEALTAAAHKDLPNYSKLLRSAFTDHPPAFSQKWYGDRYRQYAVDPLWLGQSLIDNSLKEGEGANKLWKLAGSAEDHIAEAVRVHAVDEARHARLYLGMLKKTFPDGVDEDDMKVLYKSAPQFTIKDSPVRGPALSQLTVVDHLIQMNVGEIRTRVHQLLLMPVIQVHCPQEKRTYLQGILGSILADETKHILYTAEIIETATNDMGAVVQDLLYQRLQEFNQITLDEVGLKSFDDE